MAQDPIPRDTSFTLSATFQKERRYRPYIEVATQDPTGIALSNDVPYKTIGGRTLSVDIYRPSVDPEKQVIIMVHGGGWRSGDKSQNKDMAVAMAKRGYAVFSPEYRLSLEATYPAAVDDLKDLISWIRDNASHWQLDSANIVILGCSSGGQLASLVGLTSKSHINAIVNIDGIMAFKHPESAEGEMAAQWLGGTYEARPQTWEEASPLTHIHAHTPPMLFINSSIPRFHAGRDDAIRLMDQWGIYHETRTFDDAPHPFWFFHPWFDSMIETIVNFINRLDTK